MAFRVSSPMACRISGGRRCSMLYTDTVGFLLLLSEFMCLAWVPAQHATLTRRAYEIVGVQRWDGKNVQGLKTPVLAGIITAGFSNMCPALGILKCQP